MNDYNKKVGCSRPFAGTNGIVSARENSTFQQRVDTVATSLIERSRGGIISLPEEVCKLAANAIVAEDEKIHLHCNKQRVHCEDMRSLDKCLKLDKLKHDHCAAQPIYHKTETMSLERGKNRTMTPAIVSKDIHMLHNFSTLSINSDDKYAKGNMATIYRMNDATYDLPSTGDQKQNHTNKCTSEPPMYQFPYSDRLSVNRRRNMAVPDYTQDALPSLCYELHHNPSGNKREMTPVEPKLSKLALNHHDLQVGNNLKSSPVYKNAQIYTHMDKVSDEPNNGWNRRNRSHDNLGLGRSRIDSSPYHAFDGTRGYYVDQTVDGHIAADARPYSRSNLHPKASSSKVESTDTYMSPRSSKVNVNHYDLQVGNNRKYDSFDVNRGYYVDQTVDGHITADARPYSRSDLHPNASGSKVESADTYTSPRSSKVNVNHYDLQVGNNGKYDSFDVNRGYYVDQTVDGHIAADARPYSRSDLHPNASGSKVESADSYMSPRSSKVNVNHYDLQVGNNRKYDSFDVNRGYYVDKTGDGHITADARPYSRSDLHPKASSSKVESADTYMSPRSSKVNVNHYDLQVGNNGKYDSFDVNRGYYVDQTVDGHITADARPYSRSDLHPNASGSKVESGDSYTSPRSSKVNVNHYDLQVGNNRKYDSFDVNRGYYVDQTVDGHIAADARPYSRSDLHPNASGSKVESTDSYMSPRSSKVNVNHYDLQVGNNGKYDSFDVTRGYYVDQTVDGHITEDARPYSRSDLHPNASGNKVESADTYMSPRSSKVNVNHYDLQVGNNRKYDSFDVNRGYYVDQTVDGHITADARPYSRSDLHPNASGNKLVSVKVPKTPHSGAFRSDNIGCTGDDNGNFGINHTSTGSFSNYEARYIEEVATNAQVFRKSFGDVKPIQQHRNEPESRDMINSKSEMDMMLRSSSQRLQCHSTVQGQGSFEYPKMINMSTGNRPRFTNSLLTSHDPRDNTDEVVHSFSKSQFESTNASTYDRFLPTKDSSDNENSLPREFHRKNETSQVSEYEYQTSRIIETSPSSVISHLYPSTASKSDLDSIRDHWKSLQNSIKKEDKSDDLSPTPAHFNNHGVSKLQTPYRIETIKSNASTAKKLPLSKLITETIVLVHSIGGMCRSDSSAQVKK